MSEIFAKSERIVTVTEHSNRKGLVISNGRPFDPEWIEGTFRLKDYPVGTHFLLERQAATRYRVERVVPPGTVLNTVFNFICERHLDMGFSEEAEQELANILSTGVVTDGLDDFTHLPFVTVDGESTRDLDQALYIERAENAHIETLPETKLVAWYAIADPSFYVKPGMHLYEEAIERGASIYFTGMAVPMLPVALSTGMISLNPNVVRRSLLFAMQVDDEGNCLKCDLFHAKVKSRAKLTNRDVSGLYASRQLHPLWNQPYTESLLLFREVGKLRMKEARARNVVHFNRVSLDVCLDKTFDHFVLGFDERDEVDLYNEQLSLLCNTEGGKFLNRLKERDPEVFAIFRNHESPAPNDLDALAEYLEALCIDQNLDATWMWDRKNISLSDYLDFLPECSLEIGNPLYRIRQAIERQILVMQRRSVFSPVAGFHSALGVSPYARFSAPMREIVGIFTHMEAISSIENTYCSDEEDRVLCQRVIEAANHSREIQNQLAKAIDSYAIDRAISQDFQLPEAQRPIRTGTILGLKSNSLYVRLDNPPIELKVYFVDIDSVFGEHFVTNENKTMLHSESYSVRFIVGDPIGLRVIHYDHVKNKWSVAPVVPPET